MTKYECDYENDQPMGWREPEQEPVICDFCGCECEEGEYLIHRQTDKRYKLTEIVCSSCQDEINKENEA